MSGRALVGSGAAPSDPEPGGRLQTRLRFALRRAFEEGRSAHDSVALPFEAYARHCLAVLRHRLAGSPDGVTEARLRRAFLRAAWPDLYLAVACERGVEEAWTVLADAYLPRIRALLIRRGAPPAEAEDLIGVLTGWLATPPPDARARTRLGTYDGSGSLFSWLAVVALRRRADRVRRAMRREAVDVGAVDPPAPSGEDPARAVADTETARRLGRAIRDAWSTLTPQESTVLLAKYGDDLRQTEIARLLGVGKSRVSVIVKRALAKLSAAVAGPLEGQAPPRRSERAWKELCGAVRRDVATLALTRDPPVRRSVRG